MVQRSVLPNGVRLLSERLPGAFSVTLGLWMEVGSRDESPELGGASHFIEHMAFKGTQTRGPLQIAREIDLLGGLANAFTSKENTCFHARALAEHLPRLADLLLDLVLDPVYDPKELERERQVILQEISAVEDTPDDLIHVLFNQNFWPEHPLGRPILGRAEVIAALGREAILAYQHATYRPKSLVVAAVGNLEHQQLIDLVADRLGGLPAGKNGHLRTPPRPAPGLCLRPRELEQVHVVMGADAPPANHPDRFAAALLNLILGGNMSSRLFQEVRERRGLAYSVYSYLNTYSDSGLLGVYMGVAPSRAVEAIKVARAELAKLVTGPIAPQELMDAKDNLKGSILLATENPESRMSRLAKNELHFGRPIPLEEIMASIAAVSLADISRLAARCLDPAGLGVTVLGPLDEDRFRRELA